ncbi:MAG: DegT/DnrJ/EryC1/StrS family aminotransferase [Kiritimatiellae bacterium]|nr:DegT/DnrJ/EryC1/StrS family aminotransferase [Kiritimatiellia bacterium]
MNVPFVDIVRNLAPYREQLKQAACEVIDGAHFIGGPDVKAFEREMAAWLGVEEVCAVGCATSGLFSALRGLGIGPGDEVITTVHTAIPTSEAITLTGAQVVFCDIEAEPGCYNIDVGAIEAKITSRTKAIIPVHLYGHPFQLDPVLEIARKHKLYVVEDCAQAQGAKYRDRYVGTYGDVAVFSFFPSKNLGGFGDGGAVIAKDPAVLKKIRMVANHGRTKKYQHELEGINSRLDTIQAAMLRVILPGLGAWNEARHAAAERYKQKLAGIPGLILPVEAEGCFHIYHVFVVVTEERDRFAEYLLAQGVQTGVHYPRALNLQPAYAHLHQGRGTFPRAEYACEHMLSLPMFPTITEAEIDYVCEQARHFFE